MEALGTAQLIQVTNSSGNIVKAWDLRPWGGEPLHLGALTMPLPNAGHMVDRTLSNGAILRIDSGTGAVFQVRAGDPPPSVGPTGGPPPKPKMSPFLLAAIAGVAFFFFKGGRR